MKRFSKCFCFDSIDKLSCGKRRKRFFWELQTHLHGLWGMRFDFCCFLLIRFTSQLFHWKSLFQVYFLKSFSQFESILFRWLKACFITCFSRHASNLSRQKSRLPFTDNLALTNVFLSSPLASSLKVGYAVFLNRRPNNLINQSLATLMILHAGNFFFFDF